LTQKIGHFEHDPMVSMLLAITYFKLNHYTVMIKLILGYINTEKKHTVVFNLPKNHKALNELECTTLV